MDEMPIVFINSPIEMNTFLPKVYLCNHWLQIAARTLVGKFAALTEGVSHLDVRLVLLFLSPSLTKFFKV